jgi:predicted transcriptional regulator of viral defense system
MKFSDFKKKVSKTPLFGGDVAGLFSKDPQTMRNQLSRWKKQGLVVALKKGLYALAKSERSVGLSKELIASSLYKPSYISLEAALSRYKMIPEKVVAVTSVTPRKTMTFQNEEGVFIYRKMKKSLFFGFRLERDGSGFPFFMASPEKALLDYLYLNLGGIKAHQADYFSGSMRLQNTSILDRGKLKLYAKHYKVKKLTRILEFLK